MTTNKNAGGCCGGAASRPDAAAVRSATTALGPEEIKHEVRVHYAKAARGGGCCGSDASCGEDAAGYSAADLAAIPAESHLGLGCGHPTALGSIAPGECVLDLGSGAGVDCFLAARAVGPTGRVIGVDMTPEMISRARAAAGGRFPNVEFRLGEIERLPIDGASMDVVISNCVLNLVPDKAQAFREIQRVLKPGGRGYISDIVLLAPLPEEVRNHPDAIAGCVGGALLVDDYRRAIEAAGLTIEKLDVRGTAVASEVGEELAASMAGSGAVPVAARSVAEIVLEAIRSADLVVRKPR